MKLNYEDVLDIVKKIRNECVPEDRLTFFAWWSWWEGLGRPDNYYGVPILVCCEDNEWRTPQEIKEMGL